MVPGVRLVVVILVAPHVALESGSWLGLLLLLSCMGFPMGTSNINLECILVSTELYTVQGSQVDSFHLHCTSRVIINIACHSILSLCVRAAKAKKTSKNSDAFMLRSQTAFPLSVPIVYLMNTNTTLLLYTKLQEPIISPLSG